MSDNSSGGPQWGQQPGGDPQWGQWGQAGQPQYGQQPGQYAQPQYGQSPFQGGPPTSSGGGRKGLLYGAGAVVVAGIVVLVLFLTGVLGGGGSGGNSTPAAAVTTLLDAGRSNDVGAARKVLCTQDQALAAAGSSLTSGGRIDSYTIGKTTMQGSDKATVAVTVKTSSDDRPEPGSFPTVKQHGSWKVCLTGSSGGLASGGLASGGLASSLPSLGSNGSSSIPIPGLSGPSIPDVPSEPTDVPSLPSTADVCSVATTAERAAGLYVNLAQLGSTGSAQECVYNDSVSTSTTAAIHEDGVFYLPVPGASDDGPDFTFRSVGDASKTLTVTVTKESDGHYYVTGVSTS